MARIGESGLKIRDIWFGRSWSSHNALPIQASVFEVEEERKFQAGDVQISDHLRDVRLGEGRDYFWIHYHRAIDNQIRD